MIYLETFASVICMWLALPLNKQNLEFHDFTESKFGIIYKSKNHNVYAILDQNFSGQLNEIKGYKYNNWIIMYVVHCVI